MSSITSPVLLQECPLAVGSLIVARCSLVVLPAVRTRSLSSVHVCICSMVFATPRARHCDNTQLGLSRSVLVMLKQRIWWPVNRQIGRSCSSRATQPNVIYWAKYNYTYSSGSHTLRRFACSDYTEKYHLDYTRDIKYMDWKRG